MAPNPNYQSYLLRLWRDSADQPWRATLHSTASGEKFVFVGVDALFTFLAEQLALDAESRKRLSVALWPLANSPATEADLSFSSFNKGETV